ncbi:MAG: peptide chain release factor N(5)-glutamine methyltransferase [Caldilineaceae bacterium]|nr:peptide chain release factor N(5)-glutamine methyltransferase [Caldilineaceae bacterium]
MTPSTTVSRAHVSAAKRLTGAGIGTPQLDAQVILAHVLGVDRSWLFAHHEYKLSATQSHEYTELIVRRTAHEPVAYLVGHKEFYGIDFLVDQRVLIPRPETELLVDAVLDHIEMRSDHRVRIADVGTGSGAIAISVAVNCPEARLYAIDLSQDALAVARANVTRQDVDSQITLRHGDLLDPLAETVDIIVANLPYIDSQSYSSLEPDVRQYEPRLALEAGVQGLDAIRRLLIQARRCLNAGGVIFLEIGSNQGEAVTALVGELIPDNSYFSVRQDYHGHDRIVTIAV